MAAPAGCHPWSNPVADSTLDSQLDSGADRTAGDNRLPPRRATTDPRNAAGTKSTWPPKPLDPMADPYWVRVAPDRLDPLASAIAAAQRRATPQRAATGGSIHSATPNDPSLASGGPYRWEHPGLKKMIADSPHRRDRQGYWRNSLAARDPIVAVNAAILSVRDGDSAAIEPLVRAIEAPHTDRWQRLAAIDALAGIHEASIVPRLRKLVNEWGIFSPAARANTLPRSTPNCSRP